MSAAVEKPTPAYTSRMDTRTVRPMQMRPEMVSALQRGQKTEERRLLMRPGKVVKSAVITASQALGQCRIVMREDDVFGARMDDEFLPSPYGAPGDLIWIQEPWLGDATRPETVEYCADCEVQKTGWNPASMMPPECSRWTLEIQEVVAEPLCAIDEKGARAAGLEPETDAGGNVIRSARDVFAREWGYSPDYGWQINPMVWIYRFTSHRVNFLRAMSDVKPG
ncbi:hypothetical protein [Thioalkalivibrio sp. ALE23]|uniref:hypothetical protein n=1 Tax=Thioalkalivibrio sp. ALE23 TaxID=1265495 RepID=UPI00037A6C2C|nr:hypothetical protein [Thioalkalivibrio sp. ALE23]